MHSWLLRGAWLGPQLPGGRDTSCSNFPFASPDPLPTISPSSVAWMAGLDGLYLSLPTSGRVPPVGGAGRRSKGKEFVSLGSPSRPLPPSWPLSISPFAGRHSSHNYCWVLSTGFSPFAPQAWVLMTAHHCQHQGCYVPCLVFPLKLSHISINGAFLALSSIIQFSVVTSSCQDQD